MSADTVPVLTFTIGIYTVHQRPRFDSPAWAQYLIYRCDTLIGKSFSRPDEDCCKFLERQRREETVYAECSAKLPDKGRLHTMRGLAKARAISLSKRRQRRVADTAEHEIDLVAVSRLLEEIT